MRESCWHKDGTGRPEVQKEQKVPHWYDPTVCRPYLLIQFDLSSSKLPLKIFLCSQAASTCHSSFLPWHVLMPLQITFTMSLNLGKVRVKSYSSFLDCNFPLQEKQTKLFIMYKHTQKYNNQWTLMNKPFFNNHWPFTSLVSFISPNMLPLFFLEFFKAKPRCHLTLFKNSLLWIPKWKGASQVALVVKKPPANAGDIRDTGSIPRSGRAPGGGHSNPLQYSGLENSRDRGAWQATVPGVAITHLSMHVWPLWHYQA